MKLFVLCLALGLCSCSTTSFDPRLNGRWISNREQTLAAAFPQNGAAARKSTLDVKTMEQILGKLRLTFDGNQVTTQYEDRVETFTYKVVTRGDDFALIETRSDGSRVRQRIEFTKNKQGYWAETPMGYKEKFDKVAAP